jgi:hypothetical protein
MDSFGTTGQMKREKDFQKLLLPLGLFGQVPNILLLYFFQLLIIREVYFSFLFLVISIPKRKIADQVFYFLLNASDGNDEKDLEQKYEVSDKFTRLQRQKNGP